VRRQATYAAVYTSFRSAVPPQANGAYEPRLVEDEVRHRVLADAFDVVAAAAGKAELIDRMGLFGDDVLVLDMLTLTTMDGAAQAALDCGKLVCGPGHGRRRPARRSTDRSLQAMSGAELETEFQAERSRGCQPNG